MEYDKNLPKYYNDNHMFLWNAMDKNVLNDSKLFEKIEIDWFTEKQMKSRRSEFRNFYKIIVDMLLNDEEIKKFAEKCRKIKGKKSKTAKKRNK